MYSDKGSYTAIAGTLDRETYAKLHDLFGRYVKDGYSPRDIGGIMSHCVFELEMLHIATNL